MCQRLRVCVYAHICIQRHCSCLAQFEHSSECSRECGAGERRVTVFHFLISVMFLTPDLDSYLNQVCHNS